MAKLEWDTAGNKIYESGTSNGVLYLQNANGQYPEGIAWNGLTAVSENPSGAEETALWADDIKYASLTSAEEYGCTIEAYTYPDEFAECDGTVELTPGLVAGQQARKPFGFSYVTKIGNDTMGNDYGYKIHLIYGCKASPSEKSYATLNDSPDAITFSWTVNTTPVATAIDGHPLKPLASLTIDSTKVDPNNLETLKEALYGTTSADARLPLPEEVFSILTHK